jgi:hypothetical protein
MSAKSPLKPAPHAALLPAPGALRAQAQALALPPLPPFPQGGTLTSCHQLPTRLPKAPLATPGAAPARSPLLHTPPSPCGTRPRVASRVSTPTPSLPVGTSPLASPRACHLTQATPLGPALRPRLSSKPRSTPLARPAPTPPPRVPLARAPQSPSPCQALSLWAPRARCSRALLARSGQPAATRFRPAHPPPPGADGRLTCPPRQPWCLTGAGTLQECKSGSDLTPVSAKRRAPPAPLGGRAAGGRRRAPGSGRRPCRPRRPKRRTARGGGAHPRDAPLVARRAGRIAFRRRPSPQPGLRHPMSGPRGAR